MKSFQSQDGESKTVTMTMTSGEAFMLYRALECFKHAYRGHPDENGRQKNIKRWGHWDCPPNLNPLFALIDGSIADEAPEHYEQFFHHPPEIHPALSRDWPLPNDAPKAPSS